VEKEKKQLKGTDAFGNQMIGFSGG